MTDPKVRAAVEALTKQLTDAGKIIEAGWVGYLHLVIPRNASQVQLDETRIAFFAGAQHLLASIVSVLDPGKEPTDADLARMGKIQAELDQFLADFTARHKP